ncbi:MAG: hypothetical protein HYU66_26690 [Armatimonadetes bacterium]|nr:hypothetical protein [Armatimonadota bacterium]
MTFRDAVTATAGLDLAYRPGLQALGADARHVVPEVTRLLTGSIDLDTALQTQFPSSARWDYGVGYGAGARERLYWIEVHPASSDHIDEVIDKYDWLQSWLATAPALAEMPDSYHWVATGGVHPRAGTRQRTRLIKRGIGLHGQRLRLPPP